MLILLPKCLPTDYIWIVVPALALRRKGMLAGICSSLHAHTMTTSCDHHEWKHLPTFRLSRQSEKERLQRSIQTLIGNLSKCLNALPWITKKNSPLSCRQIASGSFPADKSEVGHVTSARLQFRCSISTRLQLHDSAKRHKLGRSEGNDPGGYKKIGKIGVGYGHRAVGNMCRCPLEGPYLLRR